MRVRTIIGPCCVPFALVNILSFAIHHTIYIYKQKILPTTYLLQLYRKLRLHRVVSIFITHYIRPGDIQYCGREFEKLSTGAACHNTTSCHVKTNRKTGPIDRDFSLNVTHYPTLSADFCFSVNLRRRHRPNIIHTIYYYVSWFLNNYFNIY